MTIPAEWPAQVHPVVDGAPDTARTVEANQLRPDRVAEFLAWCGGQQLMLNGGPVVLLPGDDPPAGRLVGLGDFAVADGDTVRAEPAGGFWQRYQPARISDEESA